jgi:V8-like Glu-specific endopeptidase
MYLQLGQATAQALTRVQNSRVAPFSAICRLVTRSYANTMESVGTGFLIGRYHVLTCGHVIYPLDNPKTGKVTVFPSQNGPDDYWPSVQANGWAVSPGWRGKDCRTFGEDLGIIRLAQPVDTGFLALAAFDPATLTGAAAQLAGYPGDRRRGARNMHRSRGRIDGAIHVRSCTRDSTSGVTLPSIQQTTALIAHDLDTQPAQSGAPLWIEREGQTVVVAVHSGAVDGGPKTAVLLSASVRRRVADWMTRALPPLRK